MKKDTKKLKHYNNTSGVKKKRKPKPSPNELRAKAVTRLYESLNKEGTKLFETTKSELISFDLHENKVDNGYKTEIKVTNGDIVAVTREYASKHEHVGVMNFASAVSPAGSFRNGSPAQEQTICRNSFLWVELERPEMAVNYYYENARDTKQDLYDNKCIYSKDVHLITEDCKYSDLTANYLTIAAPNLNGASATECTKEEKESAMRSRIVQALRVFKEKGDQYLLLGAFGCGVFGNDPMFVANTFKELLSTDEFKNAFKVVDFVIYGQGENIEAFNKVFG